MVRWSITVESAIDFETLFFCTAGRVQDTKYLGTTNYLLPCFLVLRSSSSTVQVPVVPFSLVFPFVFPAYSSPLVSTMGDGKEIPLCPSRCLRVSALGI